LPARLPVGAGARRGRARLSGRRQRAQSTRCGRVNTGVIPDEQGEIRDLRVEVTGLRGHRGELLLGRARRSLRSLGRDDKGYVTTVALGPIIAWISRRLFAAPHTCSMRNCSLPPPKMAILPSMSLVPRPKMPRPKILCARMSSE